MHQRYFSGTKLPKQASDTVNFTLGNSLHLLAQLTAELAFSHNAHEQQKHTHLGFLIF